MLTALEKDMLAALEKQHQAIDILFAMLIERSPRDDIFYPSKSGLPWEACEQGHFMIQKAKEWKTKDRGSISDGYHTFDELYDHRITLYIALCRHLPREAVWRTEKHSDGTGYDGWFVLGIGYTPGKQITYHLPMRRWDDCKFAQKLDRAPEFDGHTSADVLDRISKL